MSSSSISLKLELPLYSGGAISASRRQAKAFYLQANDEFNFKKRELLQNTRNLYRLVNTDISRVRAQKQGIRSMEAAFIAIEAGYSNGTRTVVDVLDAQNTLYSAKYDYANARFDYIIDSLRLKQVAGILSSDDILNVNQWLKATPTP
jgi:outer membrane protein